ncbi:MAG: ABC transporter ATP-binding protein, partial [Gemmatimonadales bacterium]
AGAVRRPRAWSDRYGLLLWVLGLALVMNVIRDLFRFVQGYLVETTVFRAIMDIRCELYDTTLRLPLSHYSGQGASDPTSRLIVDTAGIARGLVALFGKSMVEPGKLVAAFVVAMLLHWELTLLACAVGPPAFLLIRMLGKLMRRASKRALESRAEMLGALEETLGGIRVVKAYTMEDVERSRFRGIHRRLYKQIKRIAAADSATPPAVEALGIAAATGAAALAGYWVFYQGLDKDIFLGLLAVLAAMFDPVRKLSQVATRFYAADAAAQRVFELRDRQGESDAPGARDLPRHTGSIEFRDVNFTYPKATRPALRKVNLSIRQGECLAIVGAKG